jgi:GDP-mannose 6-dehydrogenase
VGLTVSVFGLGYVGSVTAACLASVEHRVIGVDVSPAKVEALGAGRSPIVEARMSELLADAHQCGRLRATTDAAVAVLESDISFVCVGTPSLRSGKLNLGYVERVVHQIGAALKQKKSHHVIVLRSTVLPGTTESLVIPSLEQASGLRNGIDFAVCYNPEFMREGSAVADFHQPPYTILGAQNREHFALLRELYGTVPGPVFETSIQVAEMVKYVSNAFHAVKVSFANEVGTLCHHLGVNTEMVTKIYTSDTKLNISPAYLSPGFAFGGPCLPKDLRALAYCAKELDIALPLLDSILRSNAVHVDRAVDAVLRTNKKKIAFLGLSFKAGTDDLRESPQVQVIKRLLGEGCQLRVWDRDVSFGRLAGSNRQYIEEVIPHIGSLLSSEFEEVVQSGAVVVIATKVDKDQLARCVMPEQVVIDLVNLDSASRPTVTGSYQGICW